MSKPYTAIIHVSVQIHPISPLNEFEEKVPNSLLKKENIRNKLIKIQANSYEECIKLVSAKLEEIK